MPFKVCALYKTFSGHEWVIESLNSIIDHVSDVVMVHSDVSWTGGRGNTVYPLVKDYSDKIHHLRGDFDSQIQQYEEGLRFIRENVECDDIMIVDVDEIWDSENINRLFRYAEFFDNERSDAIRCRMYTHIKDVHYRIEPPEPCSPVVLVRSDIDSFSGVRGNNIEPMVILQDVHFYHMTLVRDDEESIFNKILASNKGDGSAAVDLDRWRIEKWNKMPNVTDFHMSRGYEHFWKSIKVLTDDELPHFLRRAE